MSVRCKYSGLTPELYQLLVDEHAELRKTHKKGSYKKFFQEVRQCSEKQAIIILQALNNAVMERQRISPQTVDRLEGIISDELYHDLKAYLAKNYTRGKTTRPFLDKTNAGLPVELFKQFQEEVEGLLSRDLFSKIASYVFNNYDWPEKLDDDADRIMLEYRTKGKVGRDKIAVRKALYKAYALGV